MDKSWINCAARHTKAYLRGVNSFLAFAFRNSAIGNKILCPCRKCVNSFWRDASSVREHLICDGFLKGYTIWNLHGEASSSAVNHENDGCVDPIEESNEEDDISDLLRDLACGLDDRGDFEDNSSVQQPDELVALEKLVAAHGQELYPTCKKYSSLRFLIRLLHIKLLGGWSDRSFNLLLDLLNDAFPEGSALPRNFYEPKKLVKSIGLGYTSIHACENDCILYWKDHADSNSCPKCKVSRWKSVKKSLDGKHVCKVPRKVLRYFPIKKRLQRLVLTSKTAKLTRWHDEERIRDGLLRHPADCPLWKDFDLQHPEFAMDSRNIRLAFATDGFNPYRSQNVSYSIWPGICIPYNFPPSMCMKQLNFILTLLIPGRHSPGSDMDIYYQPLVHDLLDMFVNGVRTYDASTGEHFPLRAAVLWTITDFPGLGYVSGCVTSGEAACPDCHSYTCSLRLGNGSKTCYMGHRRFLYENHPFKFDVNKFGTPELRPAPTPLSGEEILECTKDLSTVFGKDPSGKKPAHKRRKEGEPLVIFKRRSIWFILPYWKKLMLRHNFDVMHIGKNVDDNFVNTLLGTDGKSKDNLNSRLDLQALGIRTDLHPVEVEDQFYLPPAPYTMSPDEKKIFYQVLKGVKFPAGYASDIRHNVHVNERKIFGLKSHENHIILQHLLPLAVRNILPEIVSAGVIRVSNFFKKICSPVIRISDMEDLEADIAETLSLLETIFLPSFFDIMVHLMVHLPAQARIAGPVHFCSMWPVERYLMRLKGSVHTKSHPEGSIVEGSLFYESLTLCSHYLHGEIQLNQQFRNDEVLQGENCNTTPFLYNIGRGLAGKCAVSLDHKTWLQAHRYVLFNYGNIGPYLDKHADYLTSIGHRNKRDIIRVHHESFHEWFRLHVEENCVEAGDEIKILAKGPMMLARKYSSYSINGFDFHTEQYDESRSVQNSGVALVAESTSFERGNDDSIIIGHKTYYGIIKEIIELNYHHQGNVVLFKCAWVDNRVQNKWVKTDQFGVTTVNFRHLFNTGEKISDEPFILASQAVQVFYVPDPIDMEWVAVLQSKPRDIYDMDNLDSEHLDNGSGIVMPLPDLNANVTVDIVNGVVPSVRNDIDGIIVDPKKSKKNLEREKMSREKGNNKQSTLSEYEQRRLANIEENKRKLDALSVPKMNTLVQRNQPKKRTKRTHQPSGAATERHNLRVRTPRNYAENLHEQIAHSSRARTQSNCANNSANDQNGQDRNSQFTGDFLHDNEDLQRSSQKKSKGRGITRMDEIFARTPNMPKIKITLNQYGQPVGKNSRKFSSVLGCQVRRKISVGCSDWRLVKPEKKYEVWTDIKAIYDIDDAAFDWFMSTCGKKWKEFKAKLKALYFSGKLTDDEIKEKNGERINDADWNFLINYWKSPESERRTKRAKTNRGKLQLHHTSGRKSFACSGHELGDELGRPPRRDELYIKTHTRKNGVPSRQAAPIISKLKNIVEVRPELKDRTIQQGDAFAAVCGEKEPRGRVRVLGLGRTPQDVGTPGLKCFIPTRLQMEILARKKAEGEKAALEQRILDMEEEIREERMVRESHNIEDNSQHGSNSRRQESPRSEELVNEQHDVQCGDDVSDDQHYDDSEDENFLDQRRVATPSPPAMEITTTLRNDAAPRFAHDELVGKEVILYAILRSDQAVAKGIIISTDPSSEVGGQPLGRQYCEVIVNIVLKRDAILPRPYDEMEAMGDADMMSVAWPYKKLKVVNKTSKSAHGFAGTSGRCYRKAWMLCYFGSC